MALPGFPPNTIQLSGMCVPVNDYVTKDAATPGMLAEMVEDGGVLKWQKNSSATNQPTLAVYLEQEEWGKGVDDNYIPESLAKVWFMVPGNTFWGLIPSGANIAFGDYLQSNGDGTLKEATSVAASVNVARFQSLDSPGLVNTLTRCRVQVIC